MKRIALIIVTIGPLALAGGGGCGDDMMSMTDEIDRFAEHHAALEAEMTGHHREVLEAGGWTGSARWRLTSSPGGVGTWARWAIA
jgi:hypothetical protein